jgi:membrane-associated phospholipid phosphatase/tRNA A-37 threonylcarbamoyl transferase component Bud32
MEASFRPELQRGSRRRRPSGQPPPLPHHLHSSGAGWLIAAIVLTAASIVIFAHGLRGPAVEITAADDAMTRWLATARVPGLTPIARGLADAGSTLVTVAIAYGLVAALLVLRRFRHLLVFVASFEVANVLSGAMQLVVHRPRPFGVPVRSGWGGFAMPSVQMVYLCVVAVGVLYTLVPVGRWRNAGKRIAAGLVALVALAAIRLGVDAPTDVLAGVVLGVTIPLLAFRWFTPDECFPIRYRRGRSAHLDLGGRRGEAIRVALADQLGLAVTEVAPFGMAGSGGSTPMRLRCEADGGGDGYLFGKLYARSHLRADRWYKLGRELRYGRLEDEKPFNGVRRLVQQEDYALRLMRGAGLPTPAPHGFAELTPEREYVLVTEFFAGATELGQAAVDDGVIDEGLAIIGRLWHAGLAHRDIKPANLLVRDGHMLLVDVAFAQARPSPWRQAVDLANMMLCLALRAAPERVYQRALRQFTAAQISEAFAAARGLALPSQLRHALRAAGRDIHQEFLRLLPEPPKPIRIQRWSIRRAALWAGVTLAAFLLATNIPGLIIGNFSSATSLPGTSLSCRSMEGLWVEAQSVPSAAMVPCVRPLPVGWTFAGANAGSGRSVITLDNDRAGPGALQLILTAHCTTGDATPVPSAIPGVRRYHADRPADGPFTSSWYALFPGGCITINLHSQSKLAAIDNALPHQAVLILGYIPRSALQQALNQRSGGRLHLT